MAGKPEQVNKDFSVFVSLSLLGKRYFVFMKVLLIILSFITAISGYVGYFEGKKTTFETQKTTPISITTTTEESIPKKEIEKSAEPQETVSVTLTVQDTSFPLSLVPGGTVYDLMKSAENLGFLTMKTKDYGGDLGYLIEEINGIKSSTRGKKYWIYYINGQKATVGISNYIPHVGDTISWQYEDETL